MDFRSNSNPNIPNPNLNLNTILSNGNGGTSGVHRPSACYNCGKVGHRYWECTNKSVPSVNAGRGGRSHNGRHHKFVQQPQQTQYPVEEGGDNGGLCGGGGGDQILAFPPSNHAMMGHANQNNPHIQQHQQQHNFRNRSISDSSQDSSFYASNPTHSHHHHQPMNGNTNSGGGGLNVVEQLFRQLGGQIPSTTNSPHTDSSFASSRGSAASNGGVWNTPFRWNNNDANANVQRQLQHQQQQQQFVADSIPPPPPPSSPNFPKMGNHGNSVDIANNNGGFANPGLSQQQQPLPPRINGNFAGGMAPQQPNGTIGYPASAAGAVAIPPFGQYPSHQLYDNGSPMQGYVNAFAYWVTSNAMIPGICRIPMPQPEQYYQQQQHIQALQQQQMQQQHQLHPSQQQQQPVQLQMAQQPMMNSFVPPPQQYSHTFPLPNSFPVQQQHQFQGQPFVQVPANNATNGMPPPQFPRQQQAQPLPPQPRRQKMSKTLDPKVKQIFSPQVVPVPVEPPQSDGCDAPVNSGRGSVSSLTAKTASAASTAAVVGHQVQNTEQIAASTAAEVDPLAFDSDLDSQDGGGVPKSRSSSLVKEQLCSEEEEEEEAVESSLEPVKLDFGIVQVGDCPDSFSDLDPDIAIELANISVASVGGDDGGRVGGCRSSTPTPSLPAFSFLGNQTELLAKAYKVKQEPQ